MIKTVRIQFNKLLAQTPRAYLIKVFNEEIWLPSKLCRKMVVNKKLGGNVVIPTWLYIEKFGHEPDADIADTIIEKHIPKRIEPVQNIQPNASLIKSSTI